MKKSYREHALIVKNEKQTNYQYVHQYYIITCSLQVKHNWPKWLLLYQSNCCNCYACYVCLACYTYIRRLCYTCYAALSMLAVLVTFAIRLLRYTCCACYSTFAILASLTTFACYTSCPCYVGYACYIQQVVSIDNPIRNFLHCLMRNLIHFFILSKLTI